MAIRGKYDKGSTIRIKGKDMLDKKISEMADRYEGDDWEEETFTVDVHSELGEDSYTVKATDGVQAFHEARYLFKKENPEYKGRIDLSMRDKYANGGGVGNLYTVTITYPSDVKKRGWSTNEGIDIDVLADSDESARQKAIDIFNKNHKGKKGRVTSVNSNRYKYFDVAQMANGTTIKSDVVGGKVSLEIIDFLEKRFGGKFTASKHVGSMNSGGFVKFKKRGEDYLPFGTEWKILNKLKEEIEEKFEGRVGEILLSNSQIDIQLYQGKYANGGGVEFDYWKIKNVDKENNVYYTYLQKNIASPIPFDSVEITKEQYEKARKGFDYSIGGL